MSVQQLEEEKKEYEAQLELVFASLKDDPDNSELLTLKGDLEGMIQILNDSIAELKPAALPALKKAASPPPPLPPKQQPEEKWSRENHPAFKKSTPAPPPPPELAEEEVAINYQVNDSVMAKWVTGDRNFYPARITSVTGSKTAPIYTVKFKSYDTVETLRAKDIKPIGSVAGQKRKAVDSAPPPPPPPSVGSPYSTPTGGHATPAVNSGIVVAAAAEKYPQAAALDADDKPKPKFKKIKANKELEAGKNKWQEFTTKGKFGKAVKKDSMFRTPEGVKGRVGFTGSGQAMRKDATRTRHIYQPNEELD